VLKSVIWFAFLRRVETKEGEGGENIWVIREMVGVGVVAEHVLNLPSECGRTNHVLSLLD
tara:strand:- start:405 stop:584 length:180 start_codon:yes stop_codon:yes gene_type:complete